MEAAKPLFIAVAGISFFVNLLMLTGPLYMLQIYDRVLSSRSKETLAVITLLTLGLFAAMALLEFCRGGLLARAGELFENRLKDATFDRSFEGAQAGLPSVNRPLRDLRQVRQFMGGPALAAVFDAPWTPFFLALIFLMHPLLGTVALSGLLILVVLAIINQRVSRQANEAALEATVVAEDMATAAFRNAAATDAMGMRQAIKNRWRATNDDAVANALRGSDRIGGLTAVSKGVRLFLQSAVLGVGALLAIRGEVTPGVMIAASIIAGRALAPIEVITGQWRNFTLTVSAYRRLRTFLGDARKPEPRTALPPPKGDIDVRSLICCPGQAKTPVVRRVSFHLDAGEALGIIGPSAAGKSTLARALVGAERAVSGEVRIDGADISHWDQNALGTYLGYLPQEVELFSGTAAANISRFSETPSDAAIVAAAKAAGAHEMIQSFSDGYNTEIGDRGCHLSAGQRQRLGLARALYGDPVFVVLDEPNANLDGEGDAALARALQGLKARGATVVVVAHRPSAIALVDKLLLIANGEVRGFDTRDAILREIAPKQVAAVNPIAAQTQG